VTERLRAVPAWAWLAVIVVGSAALRLWLVRGMNGPFIFVDELIYSELAKSLAVGDGYAVRGLATSGYSVLYPLLIAPAYVLFDGLPDAYAFAKSIDAVVMSLSAVPAFLIARRLVRPSFALLAAIIAVVGCFQGLRTRDGADSGSFATACPAARAASSSRPMSISRSAWRRRMSLSPGLSPRACW